MWRSMVDKGWRLGWWFVRVPPADRLATERESAQRCLELLAVQEESMAGLAEALRRPKCDFGMQGDRGLIAERWTNPMLFRTLGWTSAFSGRALLHLRVGQSEAALRDLESCMLLARHCGEDPLLIGALVEMGIVRVTTIAVWEGLFAGAWTEDQLQQLDDLLAPIDCCERGMMAMRCDVAYAAEIGELLKDHRDEISMGSGVLDWLVGSHTPGWWDDGVRKAEEGLVYLIPDGWLDQIRANSIASLDRALLRSGGVRATAVEFGMIEAIEREQEKRPWDVSVLFPDVVYAPHGRAIGRFIMMQTKVDQARVAIALERYRLRTGGYPERLEELLPREMAALPVDLVTGEALRYRIKEDGTPLIWSVGLDGKDDGGVSSRNTEELDWVWQYTRTKGQTDADWGMGRKPRKLRKK